MNTVHEKNSGQFFLFFYYVYSTYFWWINEVPPELMAIGGLSLSSVSLFFWQMGPHIGTES
jgi:hypothetical protein